jgi:uncharacterized protein YndB with AHSA1/START domain
VVEAQKETSAPVKTLVLTRLFDAPRELVFKVWTDPKHLAQWWGPKGFTTTVCESDPQRGGKIKIHMRGPDGHIYPMEGEYGDVVEPERIVLTAKAHLDENSEAPFEVRNTTELADVDGKTLLTMTAEVLWAKPEAARALAGMEQGWNESLDRLADLVDASDRDIKSVRIFDAPRDVVFRMWTDPALIGKWWGPRGFSLTIHEMDVRPGGNWRFIMHGPDGTDYDNHNVYAEVNEPEWIVFDHVSPPRFTVTAIFTDLGQKTQLYFRLRFESAALREKAATQYGAVEGQRDTLDRLAELLASQ